MKHITTITAFMALFLFSTGHATTLEETRITTPRSPVEGDIVCGNTLVPWVSETPRSHQEKAAGMIAGAAVGGVVGNRIGQGKGKTLSTVGGVAAGAFIGHVLLSRPHHKTHWTLEKQCVWLAPETGTHELLERLSQP